MSWQRFAHPCSLPLKSHHLHILQTAIHPIPSLWSVCVCSEVPATFHRGRRGGRRKELRVELNKRGCRKRLKQGRQDPKRQHPCGCWERRRRVGRWRCS